jgi:predicted signal transduction protein with EAL and GGDEF domain
MGRAIENFLPLEAQLVTPGDGPIVAVRLLPAFAQPYRVDGETRTIGCSIGVAAYPKDAADADDLFKVAHVGVRAPKISAAAAAATGTARLVQTLDL